MTMKPFEIQGAQLKLGGVQLEAGNTGVVIPGVTRATSYRVEEVEDTGDQTQVFDPVKVTVIDYVTFQEILNQTSDGSGRADYVTELDGEGYIDDLEVGGRGSYTQQEAFDNANNDMYGYIGSGLGSDRPLVAQDWVQIPFRPKMRAGEIEREGGNGGVSSIYELDGVSIGEPSSGEALVFDGDNWINQTISGGNGGGVAGLQGDTSYEPQNEGDTQYRLNLAEMIDIQLYAKGDASQEVGPAIAIGDGIGGQHAAGVIAIGNDDVGFDSKRGGIYIGNQAGWNNQEGSQGENSIVIGTKAAYQFTPDNSITLNATGQELNPTSTGLFVKPVREEVYDDVALYYNPTSGEVTYAATTVTNSLAPELTVNNGNLVATTNLDFGGDPKGIIAVVDSRNGDQTAQWFNAVTGDDSGNMYAVGTNDNGPQYVWAFNADGTVKWKVGIDDIDGNNVVPFTIHWKDGELTVGVRYYNNNSASNEIGSITLSDINGSVNGSYILSGNTSDSNKDLYDSDVLGDGSPVFVGQLYGEWNTIEGIPQTGSGINALVVSNSQFTTPPIPWQSGYQIQSIPGDNNSWYWTQGINWFYGLPVTPVTGVGGPQTYTSGIDFTEGQVQLRLGDGAPSYIDVDASWVNGTGQNNLLAQNGSYMLRIQTAAGIIEFGLNGSWVSQGGTIMRAEGYFNNLITGFIPVAGTTYNAFLVTIQKQQMTADVAYVPAGITNGPYNGGDYYTVNLQNWGQGYENNDVVKIRGSLLGGVDSVSVNVDMSMGSTGSGGGESTITIFKTDYPALDQQVFSGWRANGPGLTNATVINITEDGTYWTVRFNQDTAQTGVITFDNNGNDCVFTVVKSQWYTYGANQSGHVSAATAQTTRLTVNTGVDYRGTENTSTYTAGTEYTLGTVRVVGDGIAPWQLVVSDSNTAIKSLLAVNDVISITANSNTISVTITDPGVSGDGSTVYNITDASGLGSNSVDIDSFVMGNGTYSGTFNVRSSLSGQAYIWTPSWQHTLGGTGDTYEQFNSVAYDSFDNSVYAWGEFPDNIAHNLALFKFDNSTGNILWSKYVENGAANGGNPGTVAVDGTGNVFVSARDDNGNTVVTKLSSDGNIVWQTVQSNSDNWNNFPEIGIDSNGDVIVAGSYYNNNDQVNTHDVWSFQKLSGSDGSLVWARYLDNAQKYNMDEMWDDDCQALSVRGTNIYFSGYVYDENDNWEMALAAKLPTDGSGLGTNGRWVYSEDQYAEWNTNNGEEYIANTAEYTPIQNGIQLVSAELGANTTPDDVGGVEGIAITIGGGGAITGVTSVEFADGTSLTTAGFQRHSASQGDNNITLDSSHNGKFLYYNGSNGNSWIYLPSNNDVALPIGYTVTVVMDYFNNNRIYVNNNTGSQNATINASGFQNGTSNYWVFGGTADKCGVYTIMKVDTDRWMLSGPDVTVD